MTRLESTRAEVLEAARSLLEFEDAPPDDPETIAEIVDRLRTLRLTFVAYDVATLTEEDPT